MKVTVKKRAFVFAVVMLMATSIALTSSTFAWFTITDTVDVDPMNLTVSSIEGIQISANADTWTANLTIDQIFNTDPSNAADRNDAYQGNTNIYPDVLTPVSSAFASADTSTGFANFFKSSISNSEETANVTAVAQNVDNPSGFIAFDLFFRVDREDPNAIEKVFFDQSAFSNTADEDGNTQDAISALRVAFTPMGTVASNATPEEAIALKNFVAADTVSYEVDSLTRSEGAVAGATNYLSSEATGVAVSNSVLSTGGAINGKAVDDQDAAEDKYFELPVGITKVRVYIWMEGQDVDCINSVAGSDLIADLKFYIQ